MDFSLSESVIRKSLRKYFVDTFWTGESIPVYFDLIERVESATRWISLQVDNIDLSTMATAHLQIFCFTRKDLDYTELAILRDLVFENLIDLNQTNGMKSIPLYDTDWGTPVGHAVFQPQDELGVIQLDDGTTVKVMPCLLRWGAK